MQLRAPTPRRRRRRGVGAAVHSCAHPRLVVDDDEAWVCPTVHPVVFEASHAASTMCCAQVQIQVDYASELDDVGEKREPGAD